MKKFIWLLIPALSLCLGACTKTDEPEVLIRRDNKVFIEDLTGKLWDITYAVLELGMDPERFNFGLGPDAILPITDPRFLAPGDDEYPDVSNDWLVLGTTIAEESRAYRISDLSRHEVVDDHINTVYFAATY